MDNNYVRVSAQIDEDAIANTETEGKVDRFVIHLRLRVSGRIEDPKNTFSFRYPGQRADDLRELLSTLKKNKSVELVAKLTEKGLVAEFVRIDRMDFQLRVENGVLLPGLLPPKPK